MIPKDSDIAFLDSVLPFSKTPNRSDIQTISRTLLEILGLKGSVEVIETDALVALNAESYFRRRWWYGAEDCFRQALHSCKFEAHSQPGTGKLVEEAWSKTKKEVHSFGWRSHIRRLSDGFDDQHILFLRLAFGAAQQLWTRAARWNAALPSRSNPFVPMVNLFEQSCWPLGWREDTLFVCQLSSHAKALKKTVFPEFTPACNTGASRAVFLSAPFAEKFTQIAINEITGRGWKVVHGRVCENIPPEPQLGMRIMNTVLTVAIAPSFDHDFGLPWWTFQEIDFARACGRPLAVLSRDIAAVGSLSRVEKFSMNGDVIEERFWKWLDVTSKTN